MQSVLFNFGDTNHRLAFTYKARIWGLFRDLASTVLITFFGPTYLMRYSSIAARRFREYKWNKRKESVRKGVLVLLGRSLKTAVHVMQSAGIIRGSTVETVIVE